MCYTLIHTPAGRTHGLSLLDQGLFPANAYRASGCVAHHDMTTFDALTLALENWFDTPLCDLPETLRCRVEQEFPPMPWDSLSADQRRDVTLQLDYQDDPATEQDRKFWWDFFERIDSLKKQLAEWGVVATPTAAELALKETRLAQIKQELARLDAQKRLARGDYFPERKLNRETDRTPSADPAPATRYVAYPKAMHKLTVHLGATPAELAAWVWLGPKDGGLAAYLNANELDPPPRFCFTTSSDSQDYIAPLMGCWFNLEDIDKFVPADRYITGAALIERWSQQPGLQAVAFIQAKIAESQLLDIHPIYGGTRDTLPEHADWPPLESGLFALADVLQIEAEDFDAALEAAGIEKPDVVEPVAQPAQTVLGSPEWRSQNAKTAANALHDKPGGSRDKQNQIRTIWASGKYSSKNICAEQECAELDMSYDAARKALTNIPAPSRC